MKTCICYSNSGPILVEYQLKTGPLFFISSGVCDNAFGGDRSGKKNGKIFNYHNEEERNIF